MLGVFGIFACCAGCVKFEDIAEGYSFIASLIVFALLGTFSYKVVNMTGSIVRNFTTAQTAAEKLNKEFEDACINPLSMIDMYAFKNGMSKILDGSSNVQLLGKIVFGL